ncbi:hypothetical protein OIU34_00595 [Pararhizobium sp. BT-229]|uniref:hypothetical protein n=1 Tax=Pararhizobium sp. BT-229 TaxID=2986923 RepID=UPI0021F72CA2|nr:hypothetical protein [Pararhizobium sp. BT-229]MCV9960384.1 hypothetical protein [Pararhizobium sp. BT-229]
MTTEKNADAGPIDITGFLPTDEATLEIKTMEGKPSGWKIRLAGPSHPKTIALNDASARRELHRQRQIEQARANGKKYKAEEKSPDDVRRENVQDVVGRILGWNPIKIGGDTIEFSEKAAENLFVKPEMGWVYIQINEFFGEEKGFTQRSGTN